MDEINDSDAKGDVSLSELQLALMRVLWARGRASTAEVAEAMREQQRPLAHTTVATLLSRLEKRGLLASERDGRALVYRAAVSEPEVQRAMVSGLLSTLFGGRPEALLSHLVEEGELGDDDLARMRAMLKRKGGRHD
jgi:predicted transcriptional regulator